MEILLQAGKIFEKVLARWGPLPAWCSPADLSVAPVTPAEDRLVRFIFQKIFIAFETRRSGQLVEMGDLEKDLEGFIVLPIPLTVWEEPSMVFDVRVESAGFQEA